MFECFKPITGVKGLRFVTDIIVEEGDAQRVERSGSDAHHQLGAEEDVLEVLQRCRRRGPAHAHALVR